MKDPTLILLCAVALANGGAITSTRIGRQCNLDSEALKICADNVENNILIPHRYCDKFYKCSNGQLYAYQCPANLLYDSVKEECDWPDLVECGDRPLSSSDDDGSKEANCNDESNSGSDNDASENDSVANENEGNDSSSNDNDGNGNDGACNCNPGEAPSICADEDSGGILIAHENCNQFYKCDHGKPVEFSCGPNTLYNPYTQQCDWPSNVECGDRIIPDTNEDDSDDVSDDNGVNDNDGSDNESNDNSSNDNDSTCNCNPGDAPSICAGEDSDGILIAHENCNQFYKCDHGKPVEFICGPNTLYNPYTQQCDWPNNVDCGDRINPDSEENDGNDNDNNSDNGGADNDHGSDDSGNDNEGSCNCNPGEAPSICADEDSDGILIAHENCNQFYKCDHGKPVEFSCGPNTLYNPYTQQCDWPNNVECGDRILPESEEDDGNDNGGADNDDGSGNDGTDNDDDSNNGGSDNDGTCNCNPGEAPSICADEDSDGILIAHENCNQFYKCDHGKPVEFSCGPNTLYNPYTQQCDWPNNVECGDRILPESEEDDGNDNGGADNDDGSGNDGTDNDDDSNNGGSDNDGTCNCNPGEAPSICADEDSDGILIAHENCNQFYKCDHGKPVEFSCGPNTLYNPYTQQCDWPNNVECGDRILPESEEDDGNDNDDGSGNDGTDNDDDSNNGGSDNDGTCNCNPGEAPSICASEDSDGILIAHENCNQFYKCDHGKPVEFICGPNTLYNPYTQQCDWPNNVDCGDRIIPDSKENDDNDNDDNSDNSGADNDHGSDDSGNDNEGSCNCNPGEAPSICAGEDSDGILVAHENCNQFYKCAHGEPVEFTCVPNTLYNPYIQQCDWPNNVECGDRIIPDSEENDGNDNDNNSDNGGADNDHGSDDSGNDNEGSCNCNPGEAPSICADEDSDGILIAHENCNQFYKCDHGKPVEFSCGPNTLYNPYTQQCDWPNNVECGDRILPESEEDDGNDNGGADNDDGSGNDGTDNDDDSNNGGSDNDGTCNCNPGEAPSICADEDSDGILIAHENCNQFYKCDHGKPVEFSCGPNTLYNPYTQQCDWPNNVECGDRILPESEEDDGNDNGGADNDDGSGNDGTDNDDDSNNGGSDNDGTCNCNPGEAPSICASEDSDGILIAHENCNQFYKCDHGKPVEFICGPNTLYNPYTQQCDWPNNVDCGDRIIPDSKENDDNDNDDNSDNSGADNDHGSDDSGNDNEGSCNCNPGEAPSICAGEDSDGILVAHENCNQFYKCAHGEPVEFTCVPNTLYNPYIQQCDWPNNVECGDRILPESEEDDDNDNGGADNDDGSGNDGTDNDDDSNNGGSDNDGTCNCNPGEAPSICASEDSDGILIAHENCNQFYKCDHGKPVEFICGPNTLYNPYTQQCDWPNNVDCGDRIIPDSKENDDNDNDDNSDNSGADNDHGSDDGGNDNEGSCNCNPGEAPSICADEDSDGILIAHENCNQFYKCDHGKPVEFSCGPNTLYNPYTQQCDWPNNVECGDRILPESEEDDGNDNGGADNDDGSGNDGTDNDDDSNNGGSDNDGTCNCNPGEAPSICASEDSDGILIAHENCNQFYKCDHGKPVEFICGPNTLYNPYTQQCDWPNNVDCGDRIIPDSEENDVNDNDDKSDNGGADNDHGSDDGGNDNEGSCNCNPGEAPSICAGEDSDGILVAHENCNQFYKCAHGTPVAFNCSASTLYNPYIERCDWPSEVECGDRVIPESEEDESNDARTIYNYFSLNKHMESRQGLRTYL